VSHDLLVATLGLGTNRREFQPVERALARERFPPVLRVPTILSGDVLPSGQQGQQRIKPQPVVIVEIFVTECQSHHPLPEQFGYGELDRLRIAMIGEAGHEGGEDVELPIDLPQQ